MTTLPLPTPARPLQTGRSREPAPLSYGQHRMWLLSELSDGGAALNLVMAARLRGPLNVAALRQAFDDVIARHEVLRSVIDVRGGEPVQIIEPPCRLRLRMADVTGLPPAAARSRVDDLLGAEARRPFDLARGPLTRVTLIAVGPREHIVAVAMHHAVTDGWSVGLLARELSTLYRTYLGGAPGPLRATPPMQYGDFARWQRSQPYELDDELATHIERVRESGAPALLADRRSGGPGGVAALWTCALPPSLTNRLAELRRREGGSLFMLVLAALTIVLHRLDGRPTVTVGTLAAGRTRPEWESLLGYFSNVLVLTATVDGDMSFRDLWRRVREVCVSAYAGQDLPYEKLLEYVRAGGDARPASPVSVLCVQQQPAPPLDLPSLSIEPVDVPHSYAQFDLTVEIRERAGGVHLAFQYGIEVLDVGTVELLGRYLRRVLEEACADPDARCGRLRLVAATPGVAARPGDVPHHLDPPAGASDATLPALFEHQAARTPDVVALTHRHRALTYSALNARANKLARHLRGLGVGVEDRVGVCLERSFESTTALLAVGKAGGTYVPLDPSYPVDRLAYMLADSGARCVVTTGTLADRLPAGITRVLLDNDAPDITAHSGGNLGLRLTADHAVYLIYTSGTIGQPKGVVGTHLGTVHRLSWMWEEYPFGPGERACQRTPLSFVDSVWEVFGPLLRGVCAEVLDADVVADPPRLVDALARARVSRLVVVPSLLRMLLDRVPDLAARLPDLDVWVTSGERLTADLAERFHAALTGRTLLNLYGSTEVSADATAARVAAGCGRVTIGRAIAGVAVTVVDAHGVPAAPLVAGELYVGGPTLARGYHRRPAETAARFVPDPTSSIPGARVFRTGDRARVRADGEVDFLGRADDQLKIRGVRVEPGEVEEALARHPAVERAAATAWPDPSGSATLVGYVVPRAACTAGELREFLRRTLPPHLVPSAVMMVDRLPHTPSGKVDRRRLPAPSSSTEDRVAPDDPAERAVADVFAELLPIRWGSVHDDFFALGGHSLLATTAVHRLSRRCGVELGLQDLFAAPTIAGLARRVKRGTPGMAGAGGVVAAPGDRYEPFPLTDVQQAYWIGRDGGLELGNVSTHSYFELDIEALDLARLTVAVRRLIDRHAALRTVIRSEGRQQVLRDTPPYRLRITDLRAAPVDAVERALADVRDSMSHQVLPADRWPMFDLRVSRLEADRTRLHVSIDALIADAYSVQILMGELAALYHRPDTVLEPLSLTFRDCVLADAGQRGSPAYDKALAYWRARISELPAGPELALARTPASVDRPRFTRWSATVDADRWARFRSAAAAAGLTPSVALLGAFTEVLTLWSRRPHYTLTLTLFNRLLDHPQVNRIVGDFTSLTLLEVDHRDGGSFLHRSRRLQERMWTDLDHRQVSAVTVMREWNRRRGGRPVLLAPVVFTSNLGLDPARGAAEERDTLGERVFGVTQTPQLYLDHQVAETPDGLVLNWDAVADLFPAGLIDQMFHAYLDLVNGLADGRRSWDQPVRQLLPAAQCQRRGYFNATARPRSADCLHTLAQAAAARNPDAAAVIEADRRLTHGEVAARAARVAHRLRMDGVGRGDLIGVAMEKGWQQVVAVLGICASGGAYVPLNPDLPEQRLAHLVQQTGMRTVLVQGRLRGRLPGLTGVDQLAVDDEAPWAGLPDTPPEPVGDHTDLAYLIFTSGSTGTPKGVMIDHRGAVNTIVDINRRFRVRPQDRVLGLSSLSFDLSVYDIFGALAAGGAIVLPRPDCTHDPAHWTELVESAAVTVWNSVPALMVLAVDHALRQPGRRMRGLRLAMLSGDWIPLDLPERVRRMAPGADVISLGGATEASIWSVCYPIGKGDPAWTSIPYGRPLANQRLYVLDGSYRERPDWVPGELYIAGDGLALGYWRDARRTACSFVHHPETGERLYRTGDVARHRPDGELELLGREDLQVKISGYRVELGEIEATLCRVPGVKACAVAALGPQRGEKRLAAYYVPEPGARLGPDMLRQRLRAALPSYLVPGTFTAVDSLPLTANGKIDRAALGTRVAPQAQAAHAEPAGAAPASDELEAALTRVWQQVLDVPVVGRHDNFFALGGTSLVAVRLLARLESTLGLKIPLVRLFDAPTVAELAAAIASAAGPGVASAGAVVDGAGCPPADDDNARRLIPDPARRHEPFPLTGIQEAYWLGRRRGLQLGGVASHSYVELDVVTLDLARLQHALQRLVDRHDALRTVVQPNGTQRVLADPPSVRIRTLDLRAFRPSQIRIELDRIRDRMSHEVRAPDRWPLFEVAVSRLTDRHTRLHIGVDLLIADALSFRILQHELLALYHDEDSTLPPLGCTFRDYLLTVERQRTTAEYRTAERYWRDRLATLPTAPPLPLRAGVARLTGSRFERIGMTLKPRDWSRLQRQAAARNLTPSGVLCAAFTDVLAMWSQCGRFAVNLTTFNRQPLHPDVGAVVGDFTSTTLLAIDATAATFEQRAGRLQQQIFCDLEHRQFSGVDVARLLRADPLRRADALAPVVFTSMLMPEPTTSAPAPAWDAHLVYSVSQTPQVLLDHQVYEHAGSLFLTWDYVAVAFPDGVIHAMFTAYRRLLLALLSDGGYWKVAPAWTS